MLRIRNFSLCFFLVMLFPLYASATETYDCDYSSRSNQEENLKEDFHLTFLVDNDAQKSYIVGNNGSSEVLYVNRGNGVGFIEITEAGNVMTTAISQSMMSVHSRNSVMGDKIIPSQYYGTCIKK